jgi:hypothetical protein
MRVIQRILVRSLSIAPTNWVDNSEGVRLVHVFKTTEQVTAFAEGLLAQGWQLVAALDQERNTVPLDDPSLSVMTFRMVVED